MSGMFFTRFLHILTHISLGLHLLGSAEANIGWGGKLNSHLMPLKHTFKVNVFVVSLVCSSEVSYYFMHQLFIF